ncbi:MAG: YkoF family thiamine/hydroxymethylpyrimidine-binding protein [Lewinella sp.]
MIISAELSLYPLTTDYEDPIIAFIKRLRAQAGIRVATNGLSTQITGEYDDVMKALSEAMRPTMEGETSCSFVIKILNVGVEPGEEVTV